MLLFTWHSYAAYMLGMLCSVNCFKSPWIASSCYDVVVANAPFILLRFCTETERKLFVFVRPFTLLRTETEVFKIPLQSGYLQKRRRLATLRISVNAQKRI